MRLVHPKSKATLYAHVTRTIEGVSITLKRYPQYRSIQLKEWEINQVCLYLINEALKRDMVIDHQHFNIFKES